MFNTGWACIALGLAGLFTGAAAQAQTTIYRCTDGKGEITVQNAPCPQGSQQDKRSVKDVATQPLPPSFKPAPTPAPAAAIPATKQPLASGVPAAGPPAPIHLSAKPQPPMVAEPVGPSTTIYRCTDAKGEMTVQNAPCPPGSTQRKRDVREVASMPLPGNLPVAQGAHTAVAPALQAPPIAPGPPADGARSSAITIAPYEQASQTIQTINGMTLIQDPSLHQEDARTQAPPARPAVDPAPSLGSVTGTAPPILFQCTTYDSGTYLTEDANPQSRCAPVQTTGLDGNPFTGAGKACQVIHDQCARVPDQQLCSAWNKRLGETEIAFRYAKPENLDRNQSDYERVQRIVRDSGCSAR